MESRARLALTQHGYLLTGVLVGDEFRLAQYAKWVPRQKRHRGIQGPGWYIADDWNGTLLAAELLRTVDADDETRRVIRLRYDDAAAKANTDAISLLQQASAPKPSGADAVRRFG